MGLIDSIHLSLSTLLVLFALPFLYFGYHARYWYRPDLQKRFDLMLFLASLLVSAFILTKLARNSDAGRDYIMLCLLHLAPAALTLLILSQSKGFVPAKYKRAVDGEKKEADSYQPLPLNDQVEALSWDDLVIEDHLKEELLLVIQLLHDANTAKKYGIQAPKGILLYGPPGTGKTTIAKVMARTAGLNFFALKVDEVVSKWVGESEKNLSKLFRAAQKYAPSVIFIDEVDSIGKSRGGHNQQWAENLLNHLLQLIDGVIKTEGLYIIAATNRAELVDPALLRAGRLSKMIEVPNPDFESRAKLFAVHLSKLKLEAGIDLHELAQISDGRSGAEIKEVCNRAGLNAFKRESGNKRKEYLVTKNDVERALHEVLGSK